ncbi:MAG TPA: hypothetical protein VGC54_09475 [Planctomycetota bacterium]
MSAPAAIAARALPADFDQFVGAVKVERIEIGEFRLQDQVRRILHALQGGDARLVERQGLVEHGEDAGRPVGAHVEVRAGVGERVREQVDRHHGSAEGARGSNRNR